MVVCGGLWYLDSPGPVVSEEKMFEIVDGRRTKDNGLTGILLANP